MSTMAVTFSRKEVAVLMLFPASISGFALTAAHPWSRRAQLERARVDQSMGLSGADA
ncbi:MAG: hypothetical protein GY772_17210 [bacterium]|nr:hypothetical protein [bacterium]